MKRRLFLGVRPGPSILRELEAAQQALKKHLSPGKSKNLRWVNEDALHLTLVFLGSVDEEPFQKLLAALRQASFHGIPNLALDHAVALPSLRRAKVIACAGGLHPATHALHEQLTAIAFGTRLLLENSKSNRVPNTPFIPHVTLARCSKPLRLLPEHLEFPFNAISFPIDRLALFQSHTRREGAKYEILEEFSLAQVISP